jgi:hypothetical protein
MATSTDLPPGNVATGVKGFNVGPDLSFVDVSFALQGNPGITLRMNQAVLGQAAHKLGEILTFLQSRTPTSTGHFAIHASEAATMAFQAPAGGDRVIVQITCANGMIHNFALSAAGCRKSARAIKTSRPIR